MALGRLCGGAVAMQHSPRFSPSRILPAGGVPLAVVLVIGLALPISVFFIYGFWTSDIFGIHKDWTLDQYRQR